MMIMTKRANLMVVLVTVLMALAMVTAAVQTVHAAEAGWVDADGFKCWIEPDQGTAAICGRAEGNEDTELAIPATIEYDSKTYIVTLIETNAFRDDQSVTNLTVAEGVAEICASAFSGCSYLSEIDLPDTLDAIDNSAFLDTAYYDDESKWENDVLYIGSYLIKAKSAFEGNYAVKEGTRLVASNAFEECFGLTGLSIPASVVRIGDTAFQTCSNMEHVTFAEGSSLKTIGDFAFFHCESLQSPLDLPSSVMEIGHQAFGSTSLSSIELPEGLQSIGFSLFEGCSSLEEVTIPSTVTKILDFAFSGCDSLSTIHFGGSPSQWAAITGNGKPSIEPADYGRDDFYPPVPKGTSIKSLKAARKAVTVKWNRQTAMVSQSHIAGYQIQLAVNKKFTKSKKTVTVKGYKKTSKKITKLKGGKTYYVRIRTFMTVNGTELYSDWSKAKHITVRK